MGTRSLTIFKEEGKQGKEICVLYRQLDGYPDGHGKELAEFLEPYIMVNGINASKGAKIANGMGCLTALVIAHFKGNEVGGFYVHPAGTRDCWEEYLYVVSGKENEPPMIECLEVFGNEETRKTERLFYGDAPSMLKWIEAKEEKDE